MLEKVNHSEALKMIRSGEFYPMHINWFCPETGMLDINYPEQYPDCSHVLVLHDGRSHWRDKKAHAAVIIGDPENPKHYDKF